MTRQKPRKVRKRYDANVPIPTDVLPIVEAWLSELPPSPKHDYLRATCFSKFVSDETDPAITRRTRAINKWLATEANNAATNDRLLITDPDYEIISGVTWSRFVDWTRNFIERVIGSTVPVDALLGGFSGGATTSRPRTSSHPAQKFVGIADITDSAREWFELILHESPLWFAAPAVDHWALMPDLDIKSVRGSAIFTVPKNTQIDRVACKEPDINMFLQKGVGDFIRTRLRAFGIDLNDQSRNRNLAKFGSLTGSLATLDLSSASDSISRELVHTFLPVLWFGCLDGIRSQIVHIDGEEHHCEMFSSMGNGFTFELESLLFFALAKATAYFTGTRGVISVYGDDLIVPTTLTEPLVEVLEYTGFEVNLEKSFWEGPFRESCGGHYYDGIDITPFFIKGPIKKLTDLIHLLNEVRQWCGRGEALFLAEEGWTLWSLLSELVPAMFWGGDRVTSGKFQLISPGQPFKRLAEITEPKKLPEKGLYLQTMLALSKRNGPAAIGVNSSKASVAVKRFRVRPAKRWTWHCFGLMFLEEQT